jgi:hypothetical protein
MANYSETLGHERLIDLLATNTPALSDPQQLFHQVRMLIDVVLTIQQ